ncbi:MAG: hypothetical protein ACP5GW_00895, partial [Caldisericaceae bacterium]
HGFGNLRAMTRLPNTINENHYCTYLPYDFIYWDFSKIVEWAKEKHSIEYKIRRRPDIREIVLAGNNGNNKVKENENVSFSANLNNIIPQDVNKFLAGLLKPCIHQEVIKHNPIHFARVEMVAELRQLGYSESEILEIIRRLNWADFKERISRYHIHYIFLKNIRPASCRRIREVMGKEMCKECLVYSVKILGG